MKKLGIMVKLNYITYFWLLLLVMSASCIKNDLPYPHIQQNIESLVAKGQESSTMIDTKSLTAKITLPENVNIKAVEFSEYTYTVGAKSSIDFMSGSYDLSSPVKVVLTKYQSYDWIVSATQTIERYFTISGQIGETTIDPVGRRVIVYVPDNVDKKSLEITSIKLGPKDVTVMVPNIQVGDYDFSKPVKVKVNYFDESEEWTIYVDTTTAIVSTTQVDAWSNVIWAYGAAPIDAVNGFQYKESSSSQWIDVPNEYVTHSAGVFKAYIPHLKTQTEYVVRAVSDDNIGNEVTVVTDDIMHLPNPSFDYWWLDNKVWNPWAQDGEQFWDTGNKGAATLGQSNVVPSDDTPFGVGKSTMCETKFIGIAGVGKLATGSIYAGYFKKVDGTNGILSFGREWNKRPTKLRGYYKYNTATIDYANDEWQHILGQPDTCHIYIMLTDWNEPFEIRTNPKNRQLLDRESSSVIAYGELMSGESTQGWQEFEIKLEYRDTRRVPKYIVISSAASKYGDYFTGGTGAVLWVDDFSLEYDY